MIASKIRRHAAAVLLPAMIAAGVSGAASAETITIRTFPVSLNPAEPDERRVGRLTFLGGLELQSSAKAFGGFSGLHVSADGKSMLAVSDKGNWLEAHLTYAPDGALTGVRGGRLSPMLGPDGRPITGKQRGDAEGLAVTPEGILVSFEQRHRVWRYPLGGDRGAARPAAISGPDDLASLEGNRGLEALARLPGGSLLLLSERGLDREGNIRGWLGEAGGAWAPLKLRRSPPYSVTDAALLPDGTGVLILERRFSALGGLGIKLRHVPTRDIRADALLKGRDIAEFDGRYSIDNFEGLAVRRNGRGETLVYLLSDDNFNSIQRTLLLNFRLERSKRDAHH